MKKSIISIIIVAAALVGCAKEVAPNAVPENEGQKLVITATLGEPQTRLAYEENADKGYTATFAGNERIQLSFVGADNAVLGTKVLGIDSYSVSDDKRTARFQTTDVVIPEGASKIDAYLDFSASKVTFADGKATSDLSLQTDVKDAHAHHILFGSTNVSDVKTDENGVAVAKIKFGYKTALLRFKLTFPDVKPIVGSNTVIKLSNAGNTIHNKISLAGCALDETSSFGEIVFYPESVDTTTKTATAVACVWAEDNFKDSKIDVELMEEGYTIDLALRKETLEAGKVYDVTRTLKVKPKKVVIWVNDEAGSIDFTKNEGENKTADWLSVNGNTASWSANTTGKPRTAVLEFTNGSVLSVTQIGVADFKGSWDFVTKVFAGTGAVTPAADPKTFTVTIGEPRVAEPLTDATGDSHTNNIGITGLFGEAVLDGCVEIDYEAMTAKVGLFLDTRDGAGQEVSGKYVAFFPGLCTMTDTAWGKPWIYTETEQGNPDYSWMWFTVDEELNSFTYKNRTSADIMFQILNQYSSQTMNAICGFGTVLSNTNVFTHETVTAYANFFQCNPKGYTGEFFERK